MVRAGRGRVQRSGRPDDDTPGPRCPTALGADEADAAPLRRRWWASCGMALVPFRNHWWHVTLYVSRRGLTTGPMPAGDRRRRGGARLRRAPAWRVRTSRGDVAGFALRDRLPCARVPPRPVRGPARGGRRGRARATAVRPRRLPAVRRGHGARPLRRGRRRALLAHPAARRTRSSPSSPRASTERRARRTCSGTASTSPTRASRAAARRPVEGADRVTARGLLPRDHLVRLVARRRPPHPVPGLLLLHRARAGRVARPAARARGSGVAGHGQRLAGDPALRRGAVRARTPPARCSPSSRAPTARARPPPAGTARRSRPPTRRRDGAAVRPRPRRRRVSRRTRRAPRGRRSATGSSAPGCSARARSATSTRRAATSTCRR